MSEQIEGRNAVLEAFRSGKCVDKLFILDGCQDGPVRTIAREARKKDTIINYVAKERLDQLSETGAHQGVIAQVAAYEYASVEDILAKAKEKGEDPFIFILDNIEDPQSWCDHPYSKPCRCTWGDYSQEKSSWTDFHSCQDFSRCIKLYTCCKGYQFGTYHR